MPNMSNDNSDFEYGCKFYETKFTQNELWNYLENGTDLEKQLACLRLNGAENEAQARILLNNLTGVDGKIREAVSAKLKLFLQDENTHKFFLNTEFYTIFLEAVIDINGNICRNAIDGLKNLVYDKNFCEFFIREIFEKSFILCAKIKSFDYKTRKYVTNKELFKLYWYLAALAIFPELPIDKLHEISDEITQIEEYTVKEKLAVLISKLPEFERKNFKDFNCENNIYISNALNKN